MSQEVKRYDGSIKYLSKHPLYGTWGNIKQRCLNPNNGHYAHYGGRGITICERWKNSFKNFLEDMGEKPDSNYSIERINNDKGYSRENCKWATTKEQLFNRTNTLRYLYKGKNLTLKDWSKETGIKYQTLLRRSYSNWPIDMLLTTKPGPGNNYKMRELTQSEEK